MATKSKEGMMHDQSDGCVDGRKSVSQFLNLTFSMADCITGGPYTLIGERHWIKLHSNFDQL